MNRLKELREKSGLSDRELASKAGIDYFTLGQLEDGPGLTDRATFDRLIAALNESLASQNITVTEADLDSILVQTPSSEISDRESKAAVARSGEISTDTEDALDLHAGQVEPHTAGGYDDPRLAAPDRPASGGVASQPEESKAPSRTSPTTTDAPTATGSDTPGQSGPSPVQEVAQAATASIEPTLTSGPASADGGQPASRSTNTTAAGPSVSGSGLPKTGAVGTPAPNPTPPLAVPNDPAASRTQVKTDAPTYTSYATKKEADRASLMLQLFKFWPYLVALIIFGLVAWKVWQSFQAEKDGIIVPVDEIEARDYELE